MSAVDAAAYIWPSYTGREPRTRIFWPEGIGEWETVREAKAKFPGHLWPRKPLCGYEEEADPGVMEGQIDLAADHGVGVFCYDWYWYDGRPFLSQCLEEGFLQARNRNRMKFYLMWANHDANYLWDRRNSDVCHDTVIWRGTVHPDDFARIGELWIGRYFSQPNYYTVQGKPLIAVYDVRNLCASFGSAAAARDAMEALDRAAKKAGLPGVHFQLIYWNERATRLKDADGRESGEAVFELPFSSATHYQFVHFTDVDRTYEEVIPDVLREWDALSERLPVPYDPHVSIGWDNNARFRSLKGNILRENTPEAVEKMLRHAKEWAEAHACPLVTVNSWNEWTEGSYLLPDDLRGYGYLDAVKRVFGSQDK